MVSVVFETTGRIAVLFVGDDWAQDHHDVELMEPTVMLIGDYLHSHLPSGR